MPTVRFAACFALAAAAWAQPADLVLRNGKIVTMNSALPAAQAIAVRGDRIAALGSDRDAQRWIGPQTRVIDLHGQLAIPGFIEGHGHFTGVGEFRLGLDLREARTWDEIVAQVARAAETGQAGRVDRRPRLAPVQMDRRPPNPMWKASRCTPRSIRRRPITLCLLTHASGHAAFVNAKAMEAAAITRDTANPAGGEILKDSPGNPTGLLRERASGLASSATSAWLAKRTPRRARRRTAQSHRIGHRRMPLQRHYVFRGCRLAARHRRRLQEPWPTVTSCAFACG